MSQIPRKASQAGIPQPCHRAPLYVILAVMTLVFASAQAGSSAELVPGQAGGITVHDAWARASAGGATTGAAYLTLIGGDAPDQLVQVNTSVAATAEVHESFTDNGVMKMRAAPSVVVPAGATVTFAPGGYHVMLTGLRQPLIADQGFPITLTFAHAAPVTVEVKVRPLGRAAPKGDNDPMPMQPR
jgi:copper(I)-binding protein